MTRLVPVQISRYERGEVSLEDAIMACARQRAADRKSDGVVYTPAHIAQSMMNKAGLSRDDEVWEPSCGHGAFVFPLINAARPFCDGWQDVKDWFTAHALCTDLCPDTVSDLRHLLAAFFRRKGVLSRAEEFRNVRQMNALSADFKQRFTLCVGNPPYVRTREMDPDALRDLRHRFVSMSKGNVDLYYAFIERALSVSERVVFIVPNSCLSATGARTLRELGFPRLREVVDFGATLPFADARTYVAILRFGRDPGTSILRREGLDGPASNRTWQDLSGDAELQAPKLAMSGIATLADKSFILTEKTQGVMSPVTWEVIEPDMVRTLIKATKPGERRKILFPYAGRRPLPESVLSEAYPAAFRHLCAVRSALDARDKGKTDGYPAWFAYGRSQGIHEMEGEVDLIIVPAMIGGGALPFRYRGPAPLFMSGFAVRSEHDPDGSLLTPEFRAFAMTNGRERPGVNDRYHNISIRVVNAWLARKRS